MKEKVDDNINLPLEQSDDQNGGSLQNSYIVRDSGPDNDIELEDAQGRPISATFFALSTDAAPPLRHCARVTEHLFSMGLICCHKHSSLLRPKNHLSLPT